MQGRCLPTICPRSVAYSGRPWVRVRVTRGIQELRRCSKAQIRGSRATPHPPRNAGTADPCGPPFASLKDNRLRVEMASPQSLDANWRAQNLVAGPLTGPDRVESSTQG